MPQPEGSLKHKTSCKKGEEETTANDRTELPDHVIKCSQLGTSKSSGRCFDC